MQFFRSSNKASAITRSVKRFLSPEGSPRGAAADAERHEDRLETPGYAQRRLSEQRQLLKSKRGELSRMRTELRGTKDPVENAKLKRKKKKVEQEIFQLKIELRAAEEGVTGGPQTGALPDFAIIGVGKGGTTFLYHLLTRHPYVEPAAAKEPHFFDNLAEQDIEWYRQCFPTPRWKDGRRTITGEASPCLASRVAPERMAKVVPQARLIALLRNPVDRAYSRYHQAVRRGYETRTFEEAVEAEKAQLLGSSREGYDFDVGGGAFSYLYMGLYADHLKCWWEFFDKEQILVLKSEEFFEHPVDTLKVVLAFLDLPEWEPEATELQRKRNTRKYEKMDPAVRRRLEEYFEAHNRRLYDYLGVDLGW